jgi:hypothetical protein
MRLPMAPITPTAPSLPRVPLFDATASGQIRVGTPDGELPPTMPVQRETCVALSTVRTRKHSAPM